MIVAREVVLLLFNESDDSVAIDFNCPFIGQCPGNFYYSLKRQLEKYGIELAGPTPLERMFKDE